MITISSQTGKAKREPVQGNNRNYTEVVEFLDSCKPYEYSVHSVERMKALDRLFDNPSQKIDVIAIAGTNGKSLTANFTAKLLKEEGYKVGVAYSSHFLTYNERLLLDAHNISNKSFTETVNEVIEVAQLNRLNVTAYEILLMSSLLYFKAENADVVVLEVVKGGSYDAAAICTPKIAAVTRVAYDDVEEVGADLDEAAYQMMGVAKKDSWFISAEQSKLRLQKMKAWADREQVKWAMPIRKLASLPYIYEQLYGRIASLAERIAQLFIENIKGKFSPFLRGNMLATQKGQRGRPTLEAKRNAELHPIKTLKTFWAEEFELLRGRFELLDKEKPTILLDNAHNNDAFTNLFLGIRLLHYQRPIKGLALVIGLSSSVNLSQVIKFMRYLLKKVTGTVFLVPLPDEEHSADTQEVLGMAKEMNIKARSCATFSEAFTAAKESVDERHGLVCVTGSVGMIKKYWDFRGIKKL